MAVDAFEHDWARDRGRNQRARKYVWRMGLNLHQCSSNLLSNASQLQTMIIGYNIGNLIKYLWGIKTSETLTNATGEGRRIGNQGVGTSTSSEIETENPSTVPTGVRTIIEPRTLRLKFKIGIETMWNRLSKSTGKKPAPSWFASSTQSTKKTYLIPMCHYLTHGSPSICGKILTI